MKAKMKKIFLDQNVLLKKGPKRGPDLILNFFSNGFGIGRKFKNLQKSGNLAGRGVFHPPPSLGVKGIWELCNKIIKSLKIFILAV